jgi:protein TonB
VSTILKAEDLAGPWVHQRQSADVHGLGKPLRHSLGLQTARPAGKSPLSTREAWLLGLFALTLHGGLLFWLSQRPEPVLPEVPPQVPPMTIEFTRPAPPVVEPPPAEPIPEPVVQEPPPVVEELAVKPPPPKPVPKPKPVAKSTPKPQAKPPEQPAPPAPPPVAAPTPPAAPAAAPLTPPSASAGYLKNPAPEYPSLAQRRGWEGSVLLRVHVLANGRPSEIQVQTSSGREALDKAALQAVRQWTFVPAKRGDQAQDGWVSVPIDFKLD